MLVFEELASILRNFSKLGLSDILDIKELDFDWEMCFFDDHDSFKMVVRAEIVRVKQV